MGPPRGEVPPTSAGQADDGFRRTRDPAARSPVSPPDGRGGSSHGLQVDFNRSGRPWCLPSGSDTRRPTPMDTHEAAVSPTQTPGPPTPTRGRGRLGFRHTRPGKG
ncbi:hypothetical protein GCM10018952_22780 [Streptosporangium vulgare]